MPVMPAPTVTTTTDFFGPCQTWEPLWCVTLPTGSEAISGYAVQMATQILWAKTGMQFDQCTLRIRPCRQDCWGGGEWPYGGGWWQLGSLYPQPALIEGNWYNLTCGSCGDTCSCTSLSQITLPGPVTTIDQIKIDGSVLSTSEYRLDDFRKLVRINGMWPLCNDLNLYDSEPGTWSITLTYGKPVPTMGRMAVGELAHQIILACMGDDCCKLPYQVQTVTRQGVTIKYPNITDLFGMRDSGIIPNRLGLYFSDMFIDAANPSGLRAYSRSYSIDQPAARITNTVT